MATDAGSSPNNRFLGETSSTCLTESVTVAHNFAVPDFSLLDGMGIGKHVSSCTFTVDGRDWSLSVYPDGRKPEDGAAHVSVYLCFLRGTPGVRVKLRLTLVHHNNGAHMWSPQEPLLSKTFESAGRDCGLDKFIKKSELQDLLRRNYTNCFTVRCVLTIVKESRSEEDVRKIVVPRSRLAEDFAQMLKSGEGADVTFKVERQSFPAHTSVLGKRSRYFWVEFFGPLKKTKPAESIKVDDIHPAIFKALLHFIYTDSLPGDCHVDDYMTMQHLLVAADRYGLDRLKVMCEAKLSNSIGVHTVATTLTLAEQHDCVHLKDACLRFVA